MWVQPMGVISGPWGRGERVWLGMCVGVMSRCVGVVGWWVVVVCGRGWLMGGGCVWAWLVAGWS